MPSQELQTGENFSAMIAAVLDDALPRLADTTVADQSQTAPLSFTDVTVISFPQTWPDASCGFGGIAAQVLTEAQTVVVSRRDGAGAVVYIRGDFAYPVAQPGAAFWVLVREQRLPGAADPNKAFV